MMKQPLIKHFFRTTRGRKIYIEITDEHITFLNIDGTTLYWIPTKEWIEDKTERVMHDSNWHNHMMAKYWFTDEMRIFINKNT